MIAMTFVPFSTEARKKQKPHRCNRTHANGKCYRSSRKSPVSTLRYSRACDYYFLFTYTEIYLFIRERPPPGRWRSSREGRLISCKRVCSMCNVSRLYGMHIIYTCICIHIRKMYYTQHVCALAMKTGCERP